MIYQIHVDSGPGRAGDAGKQHFARKVQLTRPLRALPARQSLIMHGGQVLSASDDADDEEDDDDLALARYAAF
ncbi:hypothetical protein EUX98_g7289 [Antrodiella citrinella]|uniref:Uncharacterized protein n=1 Tax=Antrodiella citrinella TaxID=2447956 RepID=A0A4S4MLX6_9APHY|nr:hypothetical protein EUX98_g7289 [Antrodiella citrinella]